MKHLKTAIAFVVMAHVACSSAILAQELETQGIETQDQDSEFAETDLPAIDVTETKAQTGSEESLILPAGDEPATDQVVEPSLSVNSGPTALTIEVRTDSTGTTGRHFTVTKYSDDLCEKPKKGSKLAKKKYADDLHIFDDIEIPVGQEYLLQIDYQEKRRNEDRTCSYLLGVTPPTNQRYRLILEVTGQVSTCRVSLVDQAGEDAPAEALRKPEFSCEKKRKQGNVNGVPSHVLYQRD